MSNKEEIKKILAQKAMIVRSALGTADGQKLLEILENEFDKEKIHVPNDPYSTAHNLGGRDVIIYLKQLMRLEL